jgi:hypothetical protein
LKLQEKSFIFWLIKLRCLPENCLPAPETLGVFDIYVDDLQCEKPNTEPSFVINLLDETCKIN